MSDDPEMIIPLDRLPPGFAEALDRPHNEAADPKPAATAVLVRDGVARPELLLLKRHRASGFVPGAWVFPGGRVDPADADPDLAAMLDRIPRGPAAPYWLAAVREVFEETGVLLARRPDGTPAAAVTTPTERRHWRDALLSESATLIDVMRALDATPDISRLVYCSHWITPVAEPRRYDTRFFLAEMPEAAMHSIDEREMSDAVWLTTSAALDAFRSGRLPMVFPTVKTIQLLDAYRSVDEMLDAFSDTEVSPILPRLVRSGDGVGIIVDE